MIPSKLNREGSMEPEQRKRVVITGMGAFTPLGATLKETWDAILVGKSNVRKITHFDVSDCRTQIASYIDEYEEVLKERLVAKQLKGLRVADRFVRFGILAIHQALREAGLLNQENYLLEQYRRQTGIAIGTGVGTPSKIAEITTALLEKDNWPKEDRQEFLGKLTRLSRKYASMPITMLPDSNSFIPSIVFKIEGVPLCNITACATRAMNLALAASLIREGKQKIMVAGGAEATIDTVSHWAFSFIKATSARNHDPQHASRPFDRERDGFVMAEGSAVLVLEELRHALDRGAPIYGEIIGWGAALDASGHTEPERDNVKDWGQVRAMQMALEDANLKPEEIDYINAHGTSTPSGDINETKSIKAVYGKGASSIPISSTKSTTGHLLGAAGALETIVCLKAIGKGIIPPTINYEFPDPECDLDYVPNAARLKKLRTAMNNSFGFGGQNAVIIVRKFEK